MMGFYKLFQDGQIAAADDVNTTVGYIFTELAKTISGLTQDDYTSDNMSGSSGINTGSTSYQFGGGTGSICLAHGFDEFTGISNPAGSLNTTTKWNTSGTTGSVYMANGFLNIGATDTLLGNSAGVAKTRASSGGFDPKTAGSMTYLEFTGTTVSFDDSSWQHSATASLLIGTKTILSQSGTKNGGTGAVTLGSLGGFFQIFFDPTLGSIWTYKDAVLQGGSAVIASGETDWAVTLSASFGNSSSHAGGYWQISGFRYVTIGSSNLQIQSAIVNLGSAKDTAFIVTSYNAAQGTLGSTQLSFTAGSNWQTMGSGNLPTSLTNSGSVLAMRQIYTAPTSIPRNTGSRFFPTLDNYYVWHFDRI